MFRLSLWVLVLHALGVAGHVRTMDLHQNGQLRTAHTDEVQLQLETSTLDLLRSQLVSQWHKLSDSATHLVTSRLPPLPSALVRTSTTVATKQQPDIVVEQPKPSRTEQFTSVLFSFVVAAIFAYLYLKNRTIPLSTDKDVKVEEAWVAPWYNCHEEPKMSLVACCCPCVRWGETMSMMKDYLPFWTGFALFAAFYLFNGFEPVSGICWFVLSLIGASYRQSLRDAFNMEKGGVTYVGDFCLYYWCCCCAIVQEARHVEAALARGHEKCELPADRPNSREC